ncbi:AAA family ATPase [Oceanicaulis sp.]|uniref:bifunctional aminoglycoside phosphotransferase/ATP-binding protein n=1 Tax=Oceanicaulis sp. TaxID=1924941 RepID=UPI003D28046A
MTEPAAPRPIAPEQAELVAYLSTSEAHDGETPQRIDTHLSHVFLGPQIVLKLKRALTLDFVDYSTPDQRRKYCERELAANTDWAQSLYLDVAPVWKTPDGFQIGGDSPGDTPVDWLVRMHRFADADRLDKRLEAGRLTMAQVERFADDLAANHERAPQSAQTGASVTVSGLIDQISGDLQKAETGKDVREKSARWRELAHSTLKTHHALCEDRARQGKVRQVHADLHLKNICVWRDRLVGYDALEFDDALSTIDVLYDAAFPVMDFLQCKAGWAANALLNRYLARTRDYDGLPLFDLYLSLRAAVRAMASGLAGQHAEADAYLDLALETLAPAPAPVLIALGGRSGTGKSTLASAIAPTLGQRPGAIILRSDVIRKVMAGQAPEAPLPPSAYTPETSARVYAELVAQARACLAAGYACILDATFLSEKSEANLAEITRDFDGAVKTLWLEAPMDVLRARVAARRGDASDAGVDVLEKQLLEAEPKGWTRIDVSGSREEAITALRQALA